jgi:MoaA/NifB/PqqE/SkfB family radical SAM enzyme
MIHQIGAISNFQVTDKCDGKCKICNIWNTTPREDPTIEQIQGFFEENQNSLQNLKFIQLTGGEPFLRDDLPEITEIVHEAAPSCSIWIPTNGLQPERIVHLTSLILENINSSRLGISVSIDGDAEVNDIQRGIEGSFKNAVRTIKDLSKLKEKHGFRLSTGFTLTDENYVYAPIVQKMVYRLGSEFSFRPINFSEHYYNNKPQDTIQSSEQILPYLDYVAVNLRRQRGAFKVITSLAYITGAKEFIQGKRTLACSAAEDSVYIDTAGDVYPCLVMNYRLGNIYEIKLHEILDSVSAHKAREKIQNLECPTCWLECEVYRDIRKDRKRLLDASMWAINLSS